MAKPFIRKTGFWADSINGLLLRKPYRTYTKQATATEQREQTPVSTPRPEPQEKPQSTNPTRNFRTYDPSTLTASAARVSQHYQERFAQHLKSEGQAVAIRHAQEVAATALQGMSAVLDQVQVLNTPEATPEFRSAVSAITEKFQNNVTGILAQMPGKPSSSSSPTEDSNGETAGDFGITRARTVPIESAVFSEDATYSSSPPRFPTKLWERGKATPTMTEHTTAMDTLPQYAADLLRPDELFNPYRLQALGFNFGDDLILMSVAEGTQWPDIAVALNTTEEEIQEVVDRAYAMLGVNSPQGIYNAVCWLAAKEAEAIARTVRRKFENDVVASEMAGDDRIASSSDRQETRPKVSHGADQESEPRHRRGL